MLTFILWLLLFVFCWPIALLALILYPIVWLLLLPFRLAGIALEGWEVKAIRAGRANLKEAYVVVKGGEIVLVGSHITPLAQASTHVHADPTRTRKLLLHRAEINRLMGKVERAGYTLAPINLHYKGGRIKLEVGLAKGKKQHDKREAIKERGSTSP